MNDQLAKLLVRYWPSVVLTALSGLCAIVGLVFANFLDVRDVKRDVARISKIDAELVDRGEWMSGAIVKHKAYEEGIAACFSRIERLENKIFLSSLEGEWFFWDSNS